MQHPVDENIALPQSAGAPVKYASANVSATATTSARSTSRAALGRTLPCGETGERVHRRAPASTGTPSREAAAARIACGGQRSVLAVNTPSL